MKQSGNPKLITEYAIALLDRHVRGRQEFTVLDEKVSGLANYEHVK